jgi:hypothetical protein
MSLEECVADNEDERIVIVVGRFQPMYTVAAASRDVNEPNLSERPEARLVEHKRFVDLREFLI